MTDAELIAAIEDMRADRKRYYDVEGDGVDVLFARAATRLSVMREALDIMHLRYQGPPLRLGHQSTTTFGFLGMTSDKGLDSKD